MTTKYSVRLAHTLLIYCVLASFTGANEIVRNATFEDTFANDNIDEARVQTFLETYCVKCHGSDQQKGNISLNTIGRDTTFKQEIEVWESVLEILESGEMPPSSEVPPKSSERQIVISWIEAQLRKSSHSAKVVHRKSVTRRLTNIEYQNTLRDLFGFELEIIDKLPKDPTKPYQFNNTPELMLIGPEQIDRYLEIARQVLASAIVDPQEPVVHKTRREWLRHGLDRGLALDEIGVYGNRRHSVSQGFSLKSFPKTGDFRIRVRASAILPPGHQMVPLRLIMGNDIQINSSTRETREVGVVQLANTPDSPRTIEFTGRIENFPPLPGTMVNEKQQPDRMTITPQNIFDDGSLNDRYSYGNLRNIDLPRIVIEWMEFESPITDKWPPDHHTSILFESPLQSDDLNAYVNQVIERFMTRAYRRPVDPEEVEIFFQIYEQVKSEFSTLEGAMRETLAMVLISPQFLYHTETGRAPDDHYAIASRLSYFLWASMPDEELLDLAEKQQLNDPTVIEKQVLRLLGDERAESFIRNFTMQWLNLEKMKTVPINRDRFPRFLYYVSAGERAGTEMPYLPTVRDYLLEETVAFVGELIRRNASVLNIVDSDFAMLNQRLASHYGTKKIQGTHFRAVPLSPEDNLGGLLTHGSVLIGNGTGTAAHPIYRAVWLREAILGDEVPEPPAEVPALSDSAGESADRAFTIAELLAQHRNVESCNDCHFRLDPWGIPFEQYNAIGQFRPMVPSEGIRVSVFDKSKHQDMAGYQNYLDSINLNSLSSEATLPNQATVSGVHGLKKHLLSNYSDSIVRNITRRLLSYGMGEPLDHHDWVTLESIMEQTEAGGHRLRDIIIAICKSDSFTANSN